MKEVKLLQEEDVRFFTAITRPKFVITLIALVLFTAFMGVLVPQVSYKSPSYFETWKLTSPKTFYLVDILQLNRVYSSVWFLGLVLVVLLSLGYSIYLQSKRNLRRQNCAPSDNAPSDTVVTGPVNEERLIRFMRKRSYALKHKDNGSLFFSKNSINRWGGVIFHAGLFLIIAAAIIGLAFQKRGFAQVMEGEVFAGRDSDFRVKEMGLFSKRFDTGFAIRLYGFQHRYWDTGDVKSMESSVGVMSGNTAADHTIAINSPLTINGVTMYQSANYGYALSFLLKKPTGEQVVTHFLLDKPDRIGRPAVGKSDFETTDYLFDMTFYPDITRPSFYPSKPILYLRVLERGTPLFQGLVLPGQAVKVKNDILLFAAIRGWSGLIFAENIGANMAYAGFAIAIAGMIINYLLPYKEVRLRTLGDSGLAITGATKKYRAIFEEELSTIKAELGAGADG
jgi:hypothetical protein